MHAGIVSLVVAVGCALISCLSFGCVVWISFVLSRRYRLTIENAERENAMLALKLRFSEERRIVIESAYMHEMAKPSRHIQQRPN